MSADPKYIYAERRINQRQRILRFLPGTLHRAVSGEQITCRPMDVSQLGLGIFSEMELREGELLALRFNGKQIPLIVMWTMECQGDAVGFRYGLKSADESLDLAVLFEKTGG
jgi:hypothetical protein